MKPAILYEAVAREVWTHDGHELEMYFQDAPSMTRIDGNEFMADVPVQCRRQRIVELRRVENGQEMREFVAIDPTLERLVKAERQAAAYAKSMACEYAQQRDANAIELLRLRNAPFWRRVKWVFTGVPE